jgi:LCP family protein required for cell wall assembly
MTHDDPLPSDLGPTASSTPLDAEASLPSSMGASPRTFPGRVRYGAGLLSALIPGLGQVAIGRRRRALPFLVPLVLALVAVAFLLLTRPILSLAATFADPDVVGTILVIEIVVLAVRLLAVGAVVVDGRFPRLRPRDALPVALLALFVVLPQLGLAAWTVQLKQTDEAVFGPWIGDNGVDDNAPFPTDPVLTPVPNDSSSPSDSSSPAASPTPGPTRLTVLLIGIDSGVGRNTAATDTMIVASLDPVAKTVSMVSIPRDMVDVPLARGGVYHPKINGLVSDVFWHPDQFPGYKGDGRAVLAGALGKLLGIRIDYYAQVDLGGFVRLVDSVGGIIVDVDHGMCDANYDEYGYEGSHFSIGPGRHHMNGQTALAYARIRKSIGESDFTRAARQQQVIVAIRNKIVGGGFLDDPIGFLKALGDTIKTNVPPRLLPDLAPLASEISSKNVYQAVVRSPLVHPGFDIRGSIQLPDLKAIAALGAKMFPTPGSAIGDKYLAPAPTKVAAGPAGPAPICSNPHSTPPPTPKPTPKPTLKPSPSASPIASPSHSPSPSPS